MAMAHLQELQHPLLDAMSIQLAVLRLDLLDAIGSGNKAFKLKYNLQEARAAGHTAVLGFGGAYSNFLHALAWSARQQGLASIGVVRGERPPVLNPTLSDAQRHGMQLEFISRRDFRRCDEADFQREMAARFGPCLVLPEGGSNALAVQGCAEIADQLPARSWQQASVVALPVASGSTMAGLASVLPAQCRLIGYAVVGEGAFLSQRVSNLLAESGREASCEWQLDLSAGEGGYAKVSPSLARFVRDMSQSLALPLEPIYSGKLFYALFRQIAAGAFAAGSRIIAIHTGGMQGLRGMRDRLHQRANSGAAVLATQ